MPNLLQIEININQIDYYQNVKIKLTMTSKCRDQNDSFAKKYIIFITFYIFH